VGGPARPLDGKEQRLSVGACSRGDPAVLGRMPAGNAGSGGGHGELVLDCGGDRAGGIAAATGTSVESEADDGLDQQDRQAGCAGAQSLAAQRHAANGVDTAGRAAGSAGVDAHTVGAGGAAHAVEEPAYGHVGQVWSASKRSQ